MRTIRLLALVCGLLAGSQGVRGQERYAASPMLDELIKTAVGKEELPGAVLLVGQGDRILHRAAYGKRALTPVAEPMSVDTIFDAASLTKVVATSTAIMQLVEQGKVRLNDPVHVYLPGYQGGKSTITVRLLLTHFSGLRPDVDLEPEWSGYELGIRKAMMDKPTAAPGERFVYSDINFVLLGEIVRRVSGLPLDEYCRKNIYEPAGMMDSRFNPPASWRARIAPTELYPGMKEPLRGVVHDPTSRFMGGVAGHAGLFTTADDLALFAQMILGHGMVKKTRILQPATVQKFLEPGTPPDQPILRGLGFDLDSPFSANRGELYAIGSVGHTGFTGTSLWIDPSTNSYVIMLANTVHPKRRPPVTSLRSRVATVVAASMGVTQPGISLTGYNETLAGAGIRRAVGRVGHVESGLDVWRKEGFSALRGKRVGVITNHTGIAADGQPNYLLMKEAGVNVAALLSPEHGLFGKEDKEDIADSKEPQTGIRIFSLYNEKNRRPSPEMLRQVDALVFDLQDIGARFYTYVATLTNVMEAAAKANVAVYVLDRPNPITGVKVEGPILETSFESFVGPHTLALRHGMTMGEMARMLNEERKLNCRLEVVRMKGWQRGDWFDSTGLPWVDPSPNMRSLNAALLYPGVAMLEYATNYTVGRGTDAPFEQVGAAFIDGPQLASYLNGRKIPGLRVYPTFFTPNDSKLKGLRVQGVRFLIVDREGFDATRLGMELAAALEKLYPGKMDFPANGKLIGNQGVIDAFVKGVDPRTLATQIEPGVQSFLERRARFLLY